MQKKILVIDDEPGFVKIVKVALEEGGFRVVSSNNGEEALIIAEGEMPDLILLDIWMYPTNGIKIFLQLKGRHSTRKIPVIFLSENSRDIRKLKGTGVSSESFITKPYDRDDLLGKINDTLSKVLRFTPQGIEKVIAEGTFKKIEYSLAKVLVTKGIMTETELEEFIKERKGMEGQFVQKLVRSGVGSEKEILIALSSSLGLSYIDLKNTSIEQKIIESIPAKFAWFYKCIPVRLEEDSLIVAISNPLDLQIIDDGRLYLGRDIKPVLAEEKEILEAIKKYYGVGAETIEKILEEKPLVDSRQGVVERETIKEDDLDKLSKDASIIKLVNQIILEAHKSRATDIHIEPYSRELKLRYRIDGILYDMHTPHEIVRFFPAIISRIKIMSGLNIAEHRLPQDGSARVKIADDMLDLRVSILPGLHGESIVIRILPVKMLYNLDGLGFLPDDLKKLEGLIKKPHGIIFLTGPTGSGKTTTLYTCLNKIKTESRSLKILTIEDPIEYELEGISQMQVNPKIDFTFALGLRSMLRHDPDIIMVGEVRDFETAEMTIQTALTGHLVFSTLHTNDAASGVTRLLDIGIEPYLVASSVEAFIAQRLVRVICPRCKEKVNSEKWLVDRKSKRKVTTHYPPVTSHYKGKGCENCNFTGYKGRTAIYEILLVNESIKKLIQQKVSSNKIKEKAVSLGMRTLYDDGLEKVNMGITTLDEVLRVTQIGD